MAAGINRFFSFNKDDFLHVSFNPSVRSVHNLKIIDFKGVSFVLELNLAQSLWLSAAVLCVCVVFVCFHQ